MRGRANRRLAGPLAVAALLMPACGDDPGISLVAELPSRLAEEPPRFFAWVTDELLPEVGKTGAERMLWIFVTGGSRTHELGKLWLALESIGCPPDREVFFKRCGRSLERLPEVEFAAIPAGTFTMGSPEQERGRTAAEGPQREVRIAAFELATTPVTNVQYEMFDPLHAREEWRDVPVDQLDHHPVVNVSWWDAFLFARWLGVRLPSEAEWEYACRAGTTTRFWSGDRGAELQRVAWAFDNAGHRTHAVGQKPANPWGLRDMHGGVFEWCEDSWHPSYEGAPGEGERWVDSSRRRRVYRGGAWNRYAEYARSAFRGGWLPTERNAYLGFRVARGRQP